MQQFTRVVSSFSYNLINSISNYLSCASDIYYYDVTNPYDIQFIRYNQTCCKISGIETNLLEET